jgi:alpha-tubulin suppressor-like RCC1 family protein
LGSALYTSSPVQIGADVWADFVAGDSSSLAVKTNGTLWTWGFNNHGQLGQNDVASRSSPVQVGALTNWAQVSSSFRFCAAVKSDNTLWTWGYGAFGGLGHSNNTTLSSPVQVGALTNWAQVSTGSQHTLAVTTSGALYAWGYNGRGQLGDNTRITKSSPVQIGALTNWSQVSSGGYRNGAIKTDSTLWTWGYNSTFGVLGQGLGAPNDRSSPVQVGALTNWSQIDVGTTTGASSHMSSIKTDGTLWAWGSNGSGRLGDGTVSSKSSPIQIGALTSWTQASAGGDFTLGILQGTTN